MSTINVSLPPKLKQEADNLIKAGHYASFSDLVRTALREEIKRVSRDYSEVDFKDDRTNNT